MSMSIFRRNAPATGRPPRSGGRLARACGLALLLAAVSVAADEEDEMMGFLVDDSISHIGHEFYRYFSDRMRDTSRLDFNLVIRERPDARWGSLVIVEYEQRVVYRRFLSPNTSELRTVASDAADFVKQQIVRSKLEAQLQDNTDLEKDEL
ncbi:curli assembly protein CsgE [compost metagenome]